MAVAFDADTATSTDVSSASTLTISNLTVGSGSNRALALIICWIKSSVVTGITATWDSGGTNQAMTLVTGTQNANGATNTCTSIFGLVAPTSGNKSLVVSWTGGATEAHSVAISFTGVDQTSVAVAFPHGATTLQTSPAASPASITITSAVGNIVIGGESQAAALTGTISDTTIVADNAGPSISVSFNYGDGAASKTLTQQFNNGPDSWAAWGCDVQASATVFTGYVFIVGQSNMAQTTRMIGY